MRCPSSRPPVWFQRCTSTTISSPTQSTATGSAGIVSPSKDFAPIAPISANSYAVPIGTVIGAIIAFLGVGFTLWGSRTSAKEQNGLASRMKLADFRESWINNLRNAIAELNGVLLAATQRLQWQHT